MSGNKFNNFKLTVIVDVNDGDLVTKVYDVSMDTLDVIIPLFKKLKKGFRSYLWDMDDYELDNTYSMYKGVLTEEEIDALSGYLPEEHGYTRSIESVSYAPASEEFKIL